MDLTLNSSALVVVGFVSTLLVKDATTQVLVEVPHYELNIIEELFGRNSMLDQKMIGSKQVDIEIEVERLELKYGIGTIAKIYGENSARLRELIRQAATAYANEYPNAEPLAKVAAAEDHSDDSVDAGKSEKKAQRAALVAEAKELGIEITPRMTTDAIELKIREYYEALENTGSGEQGGTGQDDDDSAAE